MPGVASRITHDQHLGVFVGDPHPGSVQGPRAVKDDIMAKFHEKGHIMTRMHLLDDPQIRFQLPRCCVTTHPSFWLRTMAPSLTRDAASWFDACVHSCLSDIACAPINDLAWLHAALPGSIGGLASGLT